MKTAISVPDATFRRVEEAAARLGVSRSEFYSRAAERWIEELADRETTAAIDDALRDVAAAGTVASPGSGVEGRFAAEAARRTLGTDGSW